MKRPSKLALLATLAALPLSSWGIPSDALGKTVASIPSAHRISAFEPLDAQHLLVSVDDMDSYVLTLKVACHRLPHASNVAVSMASNTIWAGFDYVTADGFQCPIDSIRRLTPDERARLEI